MLPEAAGEADVSVRDDAERHAVLAKDGVDEDTGYVFGGGGGGGGAQDDALSEAVNEDDDGVELGGGARQWANEIHRDGLPGGVGNAVGVEQADVGLIGGFVVLACVASVDVVDGGGLQLGPVVVAADGVGCFVDAEMTKVAGVVVLVKDGVKELGHSGNAEAALAVSSEIPGAVSGLAKVGAGRGGEILVKGIVGVAVDDALTEVGGGGVL